MKMVMMMVIHHLISLIKQDLIFKPALFTVAYLTLLYFFFNFKRYNNNWFKPTIIETTYSGLPLNDL